MVLMRINTVLMDPRDSSRGGTAAGGLGSTGDEQLAIHVATDQRLASHGPPARHGTQRFGGNLLNRRPYYIPIAGGPEHSSDAYSDVHNGPRAASIAEHRQRLERPRQFDWNDNLCVDARIERVAGAAVLMRASTLCARILLLKQQATEAEPREPGCLARWVPPQLSAPSARTTTGLKQKECVLQEQVGKGVQDIWRVQVEGGEGKTQEVPAAELQTYPSFPKLGVSLALLEQLARHPIMENNPKYTTADLCMELVKPLTKNASCSLAHALSAIGATDPTSGVPYTGTATLFVSHAWRMQFMTLIEALRGFVKTMGRPEQVYLWYDVATVNQHQGAILPQKWWSQTFKKGIGCRTLFRTCPLPCAQTLCRLSGSLRQPQRNQGNSARPFVVEQRRRRFTLQPRLVNTPAYTPHAHRMHTAVQHVHAHCMRIYIACACACACLRCLWEILCTLLEEGSFNLALPPAQEAAFKAALGQEGVFESMDGMLSKVDVAKAEAYNPADKEMIRCAVNETTTPGEINKNILNKLREWLNGKAKEAFQAAKGKERQTLALVVGRLLRRAEKFEEVEKLFLDEFKDKCLDGKVMIELLMQQVVLYNAMGKLEQAEELCNTLIKATRQDTLKELGFALGQQARTAVAQHSPCRAHHLFALPLSPSCFHR